MFRSARWRSDKNRVKAVFKLHFHATQVFHSGMDALVLSIVPGDIGKPTTKLEKAAVRDGTCRWDNPVYETVKFVQESKTGKISDRIYHFLVSTGLPKASSIGEVSINFADYVETTKPSSVSLPIRISNCDAVLHVSIQRLQENGDRREEDECEDSKLKSDDRSSRNQLNNGDTDETTKSYSSEDVSVKAIVNRAELSSNYRTSSGSDMTLSSSDDSSGLDTPREIGTRKKNIHLNTKGFLPDPVLHHASEPQNLALNASTSMHDVHQRSHWDWTAGSEHRLSTDDATYGSHHNSLLKESSQQPSPLEIESLTAELAALARQVEVSDLELQTLRKQIMKECKRGQDLTKEIVVLKGERDAFKTECDSLRSFQKRMEEAKVRNRSQLEGGDLHALVEEIREELDYEKDLNANLRLQLKKMQESNAELVLAVQDLDEMLEQKNSHMCNHSYANDRDKISAEKKINLSKCESDDDDEEQKALDELVKEHAEAKETHLLEKKIVDLYGEIEMYRRDKDELEMQMEQLALDYEILKQENHGLAYKLEQSELQDQLKMQYECSSSPSAMNDIEIHIKNLENQLKEQSEDFTNSLATIKALETHIRKLEEEMEKQTQRFEADLEEVTRDKVEQEQRAIQAEEAFRKIRLKNAKTAERLQEEFRKLSTQMTSTFDANEKATMKALTEASEVRAQKRVQEEELHKVKEELESTTAEYEVKLNQLSNQVDMMKGQIQQMLLEIEDKSKQLEKQKKHEEQVSRDFSNEIGLLKAEIGKLNMEISCLLEQVEDKEILKTDLEIMKKSVEEFETLLQKGTVERNELLATTELLKREAEESLNKLNRIIHHKDEKETEVRVLQSELEAVRAQYNDLKHYFSKEEVEKEKLLKQVFQLKAELKKKDDALISSEKRFRESTARAQLTDGTKNILKNKKTASVPQNSKEIATLKEKIKTLEGLIQTKETTLETSTTSFLQKEKELQTKIEELENRVEEFNRSVALQKVVQDRSFTTSNEISTELTSLKERNKSMESELKEMQERYLEMSLNFAEVEGERQKLVMAVRNLKSTQKG
ncbi:myosin-11 isoform X2 [Vigna radiata var. radiata]|uniref:Myosin-11 isoform X1 n=1 Tax=Vigna radiata var. radiata TaxID=3916 RepID=A0A1S3VSV4_VIGRR|nr:myosin-11 isoform X1 [Vigna radiata var. radiata]XP_022643304.1 myosin-11 isoform X2 [Vigna radiata var. radiata]